LSSVKRRIMGQVARRASIHSSVTCYGFSSEAGFYSVLLCELQNRSGMRSHSFGNDGKKPRAVMLRHKAA
jgi:hypothetical protein